MKCPQDADWENSRKYDELEDCYKFKILSNTDKITKVLFSCTRRKGHKGEHHCHDERGKCLRCWR